MAQQLNETPSAERILRRAELAEFLGIGRTASYAVTAQSGFPVPVSITPNLDGWLQSEVVAFLKAQRRLRED